MSKTLIELKITNTTTETVEVEFPIYREQDLDSGIVYIKEAENRQCVAVYVPTYQNSGRDFEIEVYRGEDKVSNRDYFLGQGVHKSSAKSFAAALREAMRAIAKVATPEEMTT